MPLRPTRLIRDGKLTEGRDGFLFLANDNYEVLAQHSGGRRLGEAATRGLAQGARAPDRDAREARLCSRRDGDSEQPLGVPREASGWVETAPERPVHQLLAHLERSGSPVRILYPLEELVAGKARAPGLLAGRQSPDRLRRLPVYMTADQEVSALVPARVLDMDDVMFVDGLMNLGDLGQQARSPARGATTGRPRAPPERRLVSENRIQGTGCPVVTECDVAPPTTCLLLGDSYCYALLNFLPESFSRLVFLQRPDVPPGLRRGERPDVLISLMAERFLLAVPSDEDASPQTRSSGRSAPPAGCAPSASWPCRADFAPWTRSKRFGRG